MKIKRQKHARNILNVYKNIYKFHEPYLVLVDGTFCQAAQKNAINIRDQLSKYLNCSIQCCTTRCVLAELELLGNQMYGARMIAQRFQTRHCAHQDSPVPALECLKSLMFNKSGVRYLMATQDPALTKSARNTPGVPIIYVYQNTIVLEKPSKLTMAHVRMLAEEKVMTPQSEIDHLTKLKEEANLIPKKKESKKRKREDDSTSRKKRKKRKKKRH